jgi:predicted nucleic acid-binding protein
MATAIADVQTFRAAFGIAEERAGVLDRLLDLLAAQSGSGSRVHDANMVATMLEHSIRRLLTFNAADFRRFARIIDIEPL